MLNCRRCGNEMSASTSLLNGGLCESCGNEAHQYRKEALKANPIFGLVGKALLAVVERIDQEVEDKLTARNKKD